MTRLKAMTAKRWKTESGKNTGYDRNTEYGRTTECNKKIRGTAGFTLVELVVVLVVLGILCTLAVMGLRGWQEYADFKHNNEAAKSIFSAAQIQLTQYAERGQLTALKNEITNDGKETTGYLLREAGIEDDHVWQTDTSGARSQKSELYYLKAEKGDYRFYQEHLKGTSTAQIRKLADEDKSLLVKYRRTKALFDLLDPYIADKSMLDAAICIEFDPNPKVAQVYSVFYNPKLQGFTYSPSAADRRIASIDKDARSEKRRRENLVGYYGAEVLSVGTDNELGRPIITNVTLNNEDTLNLSWKVSDREAMVGLIYALDIYRVEESTGPSGEATETETKIARISLGSADRAELDIQSAGSGYAYVGGTCEIYKSTDADGTEQWETITDGEGNSLMYFPVKTDSADKSMTLVLDALDVSADESSGRKALFDSASIARLQLDAETICVYVSGKRPGVYEATRNKRSNTEHQYFGLYQAEGGEASAVRTCTILNTRQFHNIRYYETKRVRAGATMPVQYRLLSDLDWAFTLNSGCVYAGAASPVVPELLETAAEEDRIRANFKPILRLGRNARLMTTDSGDPHILKNFRLYLANVPAIAEGSDIPGDAAGLFVLNEGTMENLRLVDVQVQGLEIGPSSEEVEHSTGAAGGFCGWNRGNLTKLTVQSGSVSGDCRVGGILGAMDGQHEATLSELVNRAEVRGNLYVGGIAGSLEARSGALTVTDCANYGAVTGVNRSGAAAGDEDAYYIGGIAGHTRVAETVTGVIPGLRLEACVSSPVYGDDRLDALVKEIEASIADGTEPEGLNGIYVGGIVGLNQGGVIANCNTLRESETERGYVIGKRYVGGIVGFNEGDTGIIGGESARNQVQVIGHDFVGGIVGCNAKGAWSENSREVRILSKEEANAADGLPANAPEDVVIQNWVNEGAVFAVGEYAGGITGFNYGKILGCNSNVDYTDAVRNLTTVTTNAQYTGGIAGYNAGLIDGSRTEGGTDIRSAVSMVSGSNFVGGIAGYNDVHGTVSNYELRGGYIRGQKFVGGFIGLNADKSVFENRVYCNPNEVSGTYFVGGIIGANLVPTDADITARFKADNFLGSLTAQGAFAGGFIGYNHLLTATTAAGDIKQAAELLCAPGTLPEIAAGEDNSVISERLQHLEEPLERFMGNSGSSNTKHKMIITGEQIDETEINTQTRLGGITGLVYVGGVVGYNQESTLLVIRNVENITPVWATAYIEREESGIVTDADGTVRTVTIGADLEGRTKRYSYAGGIIGKVARNVTLDNCKNRDVGEVRTQGTYTGGLAEINEGLIVNCVAGSLGDGTGDYIGGLAGVNLGTIEEGTVTGTIMGASRIGGLVSENYGTILNASTGMSAKSRQLEDCYMEATGRDIGGIAGYGFAGSRILWTQEMELNIHISGTGIRVGGVVGTNEGTIAAAFADGSAATDRGIRNMEGNSIIGSNYVGGFVGVQRGHAAFAHMQNYAEVQADRGFAGGIVAWIIDAASGGTGSATSGITNCVNYGPVRVLSEGDEDEVELIPDLGGEEDEEGLGSAIENEDEDLINSVAGGITAVNFGVIRECVNYGVVDAGNGFGGGIAGLNYHRIEYSRVGGEAGTDLLELNGDRYVGGITAKNKPDAVIANSAVMGLLLQNQTFTAEGYMGGVAGENLGSIENCTVGVNWRPEERRSSASLYSELHQEASEAVMEAVRSARAGATDSSYTLEEEEHAVILLSNAANATMGGVAGINRYPEEEGSNKKNGTITGMKEDQDGEEAYTVVLAELKFTEHTMSYYGNLGGIAGVNQGDISYYEYNGFVHGTANDPANTPEYSPNYDYEPNKSVIYGYGGIAGINGSDRRADDAKISHCLMNMARINGIGSATNRTNVGGVAGVNGADAEITRIRFGRMDDLEAMRTEKENPRFFTSAINGVTRDAAVWIGTDYAAGVGHVGGIAGYNQGLISHVNDWEAYEQNRENYVTEEGIYVTEAFADAQTDETAVIVFSTGHTGGVAGYNRRTGEIRRAVTGRQWLVGAIRQEQDNGTGGIIGYNDSERNLEFCDNHAFVVKNTGNAVGGVVGRNEIATTNSWRFYDCRNYGTVTATSRGGGIIGHWKYRGGTLENCVNFGRVTAVQGNCAGIVAMMYALNVGEQVNFVNCKNFGDIGSPSGTNIAVGGILGEIDKTNSSGRYANLYNCVNTGRIGGRDNMGSAGMIAKPRNMIVNLNYCKNYGYSMDGVNGTFSGMYCKEEDSGLRVTMRDCFGVTDRTATGHPITHARDSRDGGYYFAGDVPDSENENFFYIQQIEAYGKGQNLKTGDNLGYIISSALGSTNTWFQEAGSQDRSALYTITFNQPVNLKKLELNWNRGTADDYRYYRYRLNFFDKSGKLLENLDVEETPGNRNQSYHDNLGLEDVYRVEIRDAMVSCRGAKSLALVSLSASALFDGDEVAVSKYSYQASHIAEASTATSARYALPEDLQRPQGNTNEQILDQQYGVPLYVDQKDGTYMASSLAGQAMIEDLGNNSLSDILLTAHVPGRMQDSRWSYQLYQKLNPYLVIRNATVGLEIPHVGAGTAAGGYYKISWKAISQAQYYHVSYVYIHKDENGTETELGETDAEGHVMWNHYTAYTPSIDILSGYTYRGIRANGVKIKVQAGARTTAGEEILSDWSEEAAIEFGITLPTPLVRWELVTLEEDACYRIVLDNKKEYEALQQDYPDLKLEDITITTWLLQNSLVIEGTRKTFSVADGALFVKPQEEDYLLLPGYDDKNRYLLSYAATTDARFAQSPEFMREAQLPGRGDYMGGTGNSGGMADAALEASKTQETGFYGDTMTSLYYQTLLQAEKDGSGNEWVVNYRTELVATKNTLGIPIAYAVSPYTRTSPAGTPTARIILNGLPNDFLDRVSAQEDADYQYGDVAIRMYPSKMSNDIFYQGWSVKLPDGQDTMTLEELAGLHVSEDGRILVSDQEDTRLIQETGGEKTVKPGYVIEYAGQDAYTLYYNTLLREMMRADKGNEKDWQYTWGGQKDTYRYRQVMYHDVDLKEELFQKGIQPEPIAYANAELMTLEDGTKAWQDGNYQEADEFVFTWDQKADVDKPAYGTTVNPYQEGAIYQLSAEGVTMGLDANQQEVETTTPLATNVRFVTTNAREYNTWKADSGSWTYDRIRITLTRLGEMGPNGVTNKFPATVTREYVLKKRLATIGRPRITNKTEGGEIQKDGLEYVINWTGIHQMSLSDTEKASQEEAFGRYEVAITGATSGVTAVLHTTEGDMTQTEATVDFSKPVTMNGEERFFYQGEAIGITVTALAKEGSETYRSGITSAALETSIPVRLMAPDMGSEDDPSPNLTAEIPAFMSVSDFVSKGITLRMQGESGVKYQIALWVFEDEEAAHAGTNPIEVIGLPEKSDSNRIYMSDEHTYQVKGIPAEYAGKCLKVVLRAVSDNSISSVWTDEDTTMQYISGAGVETHEPVVPYRLFPLSSVQVDAPALGERVGTKSCEYDLVNDGGATEYVVTATQNVITFETAQYADDYRMTIIQTPQPAERTATPSNADAEMVVSDVIWMEIEKVEDDADSYRVTYRSTELPDIVAGGSNEEEPEPTEPEDDVVITIGGGAVALPYKKEIPIAEDSESGEAYTLPLRAWIQAEVASEGKVKFTLTLPDTEKVEAGSDEVPLNEVNTKFTEQILVQSIANDTENQTYRDSDWALAARVGDGPLRKIPNAIPIPEMEAGYEPNLSDTQVKSSTHTGFAYELATKFDGATRYLVQVTDEAGNPLGIYGVPYDKKNSINQYHASVWLPAELASVEGQTVTITFGSIISVTGNNTSGYGGGGLSPFSETPYDLILPPIEEARTVSATQYISDPIVCETTVSGRSRRSVITKTVTAKQTQMEWDYLDTDVNVTGYDITISGINMGADYNLELDLRKNRFGQYSELRDYMTPEGQVLYSVAYDLQGDMVPFIKPAETASSSNATEVKATASNATASNATATPSVMNQPGILVLNGSLRIEPMKGGLHFILTLPDAAIGQLKGSAAEQYQDSEYYYDGGLYNTQQMQITPVMINEFYPVPEPEWIPIRHDYREEDEEGYGREFDSEDGLLKDDRN